MSQNACLCRLVVVGHNGQDRVGAGCLGRGRQFQRLAGRVRTGPGDDGYPAACDTDGRGNDFFVLVAAECRILTHGFTDPNKLRPCFRAATCESAESTVANLAMRADNPCEAGV